MCPFVLTLVIVHPLLFLVESDECQLTNPTEEHTHADFETITMDTSHEYAYLPLDAKKCADSTCIKCFPISAH